MTDQIEWQGENRLVVRIGAHPDCVPKWAPTGTDFEKNKWISGIYDSIFLYLCDSPVIESIQVAPRISPPEITVQTHLRNYGPARQVHLAHNVRTWKDRQTAAASSRHSFEMAEGENL